MKIHSKKPPDEFRQMKDAQEWINKPRRQNKNQYTILPYHYMKQGFRRFVYGVFKSKPAAEI